MTETTEYKGYTIETKTENYPTDPREWDNLGVMAALHNRYNLGDEDFWLSHSYMKDHVDECSSWECLEAEFEKEFDIAVILPLFLYDHSGIAISTRSWHGRAHHAEWDSGQVGFIFVSKDKIRDEYGWKRLTKKRLEKIEQYLVGEVEEYNDYLTGNVYCWFVKDQDGETIESCGGYYGYDGEKYAIEEAKSTVNYLVKQEAACIQ